MFSRSSCMGIKPSRKVWTSVAVISWGVSLTLDSPATGCGDGMRAVLRLCDVAPGVQSSASRRTPSRHTDCFMEDQALPLPCLFDLGRTKKHTTRPLKHAGYGVIGPMAIGFDAGSMNPCVAPQGGLPQIVDLCCLPCNAHLKK